MLSYTCIFCCGRVIVLKILVCIKQVPGSSNVKVNPETGVLIRDGIESKMNPYDLFALEVALTLKDTHGASVTVITMGPPAADTVIKEAIYMGAEKGVLVSDRRFGGADVLATSYTLSQAIRAMGEFDLILTGKQTTDGDTAQVGPELAEFLKLPHFTGVTEILRLDNGNFEYTATLDNKIISAEITSPCLLCVDGKINTPRLPSYKRKILCQNNEELIKVVSLDDFNDKNSENYGLKGSPTQVERIFPPEINADRKIFEGESETLASEILNVIVDKKFI